MSEGVTVESSYIHRGRRINLRSDRIRAPSGQELIREVVEHPGAVAIVALDAEGQVILVRQYRHAVGRTLLEIPAGTLEPGEDPLECARRELEEETGYAAARWERIAGFYSSPGFCDEYLTIFQATGLSATPTRPDPDEIQGLVCVPLSETPRLIASGEICDSKSIIGLLTVAQGRGGA